MRTNLNIKEVSSVQISLFDTAKSYAKLKQELKIIEDQLQKHKEFIESNMNLLGVSTLQLDEVSIDITNQGREVFNLKSAKNKLEEILTPFISHSNYTVLKVKDNSKSESIRQAA
jgi:hypothetical protein